MSDRGLIDYDDPLGEAARRIAELDAEVARLAGMRERSVAEYIKSREYIAALEAERDRLQEALRLKYGDVLAERDRLREALTEITEVRLHRSDVMLVRVREIAYAALSPTQPAEETP